MYGFHWLKQKQYPTTFLQGVPHISVKDKPCWFQSLISSQKIFFTRSVVSIQNPGYHFKSIRCVEIIRQFENNMATDGQSWHVNIAKKSQQENSKMTSNDIVDDVNITLLQVFYFYQNYYQQSIGKCSSELNAILQYVPQKKKVLCCIALLSSQLCCCSF